MMRIHKLQKKAGKTKKKHKRNRKKDKKKEKDNGGKIGTENISGIYIH